MQCTFDKPWHLRKSSRHSDKTAHFAHVCKTNLDTPRMRLAAGWLLSQIVMMQEGGPLPGNILVKISLLGKPCHFGQPPILGSTRSRSLQKKHTTPSTSSPFSFQLPCTGLLIALAFLLKTFSIQVREEVVHNFLHVIHLPDLHLIHLIFVLK